LTGAQPIWEQPIGSHICSPIIQGNRIYMAGPQLYCLDWTTGKTLWEGANFNYGASCLLTTDGRLVVSGNRGKLILAESAERFPTSYKELDSKRVLAGKDVWSHVVLADRRYYVKDVEGNLVCLSIAR
jgi:outer membrane protein assembly factor BamB